MRTLGWLGLVLLVACAPEIGGGDPDGGGGARDGGDGSAGDAGDAGDGSAGDADTRRTTCSKGGNCPGFTFQSEAECREVVETCTPYDVCGAPPICGWGKCKKQPSCDPGDRPVTECPEGGDCYTRATCSGGGFGSTSEVKILCVRAGDVGDGG